MNARTHSMLDVALALARQSFKVIPVAPGAKAPPLIGNFPERATTDEAQIREWWAQWPDANPAIHCAGLLVLDVDPKSGGRESWKALRDLLDLPETRAHSTPSDGGHAIYRLPAGHPGVSNSVGKLGKGLDTRSTGGYILAPGAIVNGVAYTVQKDVPIAVAPAVLVAKLGRVEPKKAPQDVPDASAEVMERVAEWLKMHKPAIERQGGDLHTYVTACLLRDKGVSAQQALELMAGEWNARCEPPWSLADLETKARNAFRYCQNEEGGKRKPLTASDLDAALATDHLHTVEARHLTTDLANARRIQKAYGKALVFSAGRWHAWTGTHWEADAGAAYRCAANLSKIIAEERGEREQMAEKAATEEERKLHREIAETLRKWGAKSEDGARIAAALSTLRSFTEIPAEKLDADLFALNCANGTVDLRTGALRPHNPFDYITHCTPVKYAADAKAPRFEQFVLEIAGGDAQLAALLQRWSGYSATGDTREQKFAIHWGGGSNGKSTFIEMVAEVLGDYATAAPPGLLTAARGERHPTEIATLMGKRLVTAHESAEEAALREDFVKQATGGDTLSARFMRGDFFDFRPTHKLQLLTNHKPRIAGQDHGLWRRLVLIPYSVIFGDPEEVAAGKATRRKDAGLKAKLREEMPGILRWIVAGAVAWHREGLRLPAAVNAAVQAYRSEQDTISEFLTEHVSFDAQSGIALDGMPGALWPAYVNWCRDDNLKPFSKKAFVAGLERCVPTYSSDETRMPVDGKRRAVRVIHGVKPLEGSGLMTFEAARPSLKAVS